MYTVRYIGFDDVPQFSERDKAFQRLDPRLEDLMVHTPDLDSFRKVVDLKQKHQIDRALLQQVLTEQYSDIKDADKTLDHIALLGQEHTYTIITAHQPSILTGPLYFIYKIASAISLARQVDELIPEIKVVPVFITGGEDHDFDEIATMHLFGQDFTWSTDQIGATGRMTLDGLDELIEAVKTKLGSSETAQELVAMIDHSLATSSNYGQFMISLTHALFAEYGVIVANMDDERLKQVLLPYVLRDLESLESQRCVQADQEVVQSQGFKSQAHAREVNIFWHDGDRHRVVAVDAQTYRIGEHILPKESLIEQLQSDSGNISPNVILRPIYQEIIFPNLAYVGGGGELAYWLERKSLFETWEIPFPMLVRRDSIHIIDKKTAQLLEKSEVDIVKLFDREDHVVEAFTRSMSSEEIHLKEEKSTIEELYTKIADRLADIDPTLKKTALGEASKAVKSLDYLESKMLKAEKNKHEVILNRVKKAKKKLFPGNNSLQERYDNFIPFYLKYGRAWIDKIVDIANPMDKNMKILIED